MEFDIIDIQSRNKSHKNLIHHKWFKKYASSPEKEEMVVQLHQESISIATKKKLLLATIDFHIPQSWIIYQYRAEITNSTEPGMGPLRIW